MKKIEDLKIKIFSDGAMLEDFKKLSKLPYIKGFTTNPSLMRKAGVIDYAGFIRDVLPIVGGKPISFEVLSDDFAAMRAQALRLSRFGDNVYVKIPIINTRGEPSVPLIKELNHMGVRVNVTAILTQTQVEEASGALRGGAPAVISVFAGRIADTGVDPVPIMKKARDIMKPLKDVELLWASTRELLNIFQAEEAGCDIITVPPDILKKINAIGRDLYDFSLDTVKTFASDGMASGLKI